MNMFFILFLRRIGNIHGAKSGTYASLISLYFHILYYFVRRGLLSVILRGGS